MNLKKAMAASVLLLAAACGTAAAKDKATTIWLQASVQLDAQGHVTGLDWDKGTSVHQMIAERLTGAVKAWEFVPATMDGQAVETRTGLAVQLLASAGDNGALDLTLVSASTGPMAVYPTPPPYPADAMWQSVGGTVFHDIAVAADGTPTLLDSRFVGEGRVSRKMQAQFLESTVKAVQAWTYHPEIVGGRASDALVRIPVNFCPSAYCKTPADPGARSAKAPVAANLYIGDSAVALKTPIEGASI